jgi:hypothetical protein
VSAVDRAFARKLALESDRDRQPFETTRNDVFSHLTINHFHTKVMDGLSAASGVIAVVSLAAQLGNGIKLL